MASMPISKVDQRHVRVRAADIFVRGNIIGSLLLSQMNLVQKVHIFSRNLNFILELHLIS